MRYAFHISALIVFLASTGFVPSVHAQEKSPTDLDRQLLEQLDEFDEQLGGDAAADVGKSDAAGPNSEAAGDSGTPSIDQELLDKLDEGEDIPLGPDAQPIEQLGEDADPLTRIGEKMRIVERLLQARSAQPRTQELQGEIVHDLEELLKQLQRQMQQQAASGSDSPKPQQQGGRSKIQLPDRQTAQKPGQEESERPATDSEDRVGRSQPPKVDLAELTEVIKQIWGHLPEKDRERLRQMSAEEAMPDHELAIEKYFRYLSEKEND